MKCEDSWVQHNGHCYTLNTDYTAPTPSTTDSFNLDDPIVYCGNMKAYMAVIHDAVTNDVIRKLGFVFILNEKKITYLSF